MGNPLSILRTFFQVILLNLDLKFKNVPYFLIKVKVFVRIVNIHDVELKTEKV